MKKNIIYISYDGMYESLGQSQVLSYLNLMLSDRISIDLISFEKEADLSKNSHIEISEEIKWHKLKYHKKLKLFSALYDIFNGLILVAKLHYTKRISLIHSRSYISSLIALVSFYFFKIPFIFDIRGLWIDEKIESGSWSSIAYKPVVYFFRRLEILMLKNANSIVVLTENSKSFLAFKYSLESNKITVIPTCVNYDIFSTNKLIRNKIRKQLHLENDIFLLIYSGSIGGYYRFDYILDFFEELQLFTESKLLLLTKTNPEFLNLEIQKRNLTDKVIIKSVKFIEVVDFLNASDAGLIIYEKTTSSIARSSTKLGEYWACDLPVFAPSDVGDVNFLFKLNKQNHLLLNSFKRINYNYVLNNFFHTKISYNLNDEVRKYFDLKNGVDRYLEIYNLYE